MTYDDATGSSCSLSTVWTNVGEDAGDSNVAFCSDKGIEAGTLVQEGSRSGSGKGCEGERSGDERLLHFARWITWVAVLRSLQRQRDLGTWRYLCGGHERRTRPTFSGMVLQSPANRGPRELNWTRLARWRKHE